MRIGLICMAILGFMEFAYAQDKLSLLETDVEQIKQNQNTILEELKSIKAILSRLPLPAPEVDVRGMEVDLSGRPVIAKGSSKLVMIEISDYQCPFCSRYASETFPEIKKLYIDNGKIDYTTIDMPLPIHPLAPKAAEAAHCAEDQGKFWEMHGRLMADQQSLDKLSSYATALNLDMPKYEECLKSNRHADSIAKDIALTKKMGISGVPGFLLATRDSKNPSRAKAVSMIRGAMPITIFQKEIDKSLAEAVK